MADIRMPPPGYVVRRCYIDGGQQFHEFFTIPRQEISTTPGIKRKRYDGRQSEMIQRSAMSLVLANGPTDITNLCAAGQSDLDSETYHLFDPTKVAGYVSAVSLPPLHWPSLATDLPNYLLTTPTKTPASVYVPRDHLPSFDFSDGITGTHLQEASVYTAFQKDRNGELVDYESFNNNDGTVEAQKQVDHIMGNLQQLGSRQRMYAKSQLKFIEASSL